jgi:two-component system phosphate regulon sensor histidine kinase PhoR
MDSGKQSLPTSYAFLAWPDRGAPGALRGSPRPSRAVILQRVRFPPAIVQLRRAQLVLILAVLVPTVLMIAVGIVLLAVGGSEVGVIVAGVLVLTFCTTAITGYILGSIFLGRGASLAKVQSDFLSSVSHELRTPLTAIGLFIESLRNGRLSSEDQPRVLRLLETEVARMDTLVGRLLELSRLESGAHIFERARVEVAEIVREAQAAFDAATLSCPTGLAVELEPGLSLVGDRATLVQATANLLINAWKYTGVDKRISLQAWSVGRWIEITVADNGIGIPRDERREVFEEFSRGKEATRRGTPGVGLGLALVRAVVRAHKGTVEVSSRPGGGSIFRLRLPRGRLESVSRSETAA